MTAGVQPARFVTIPLAELLTGYTTAAIETKIARGVWVEGREWRRAPDGRVLIDMRGYENVGADGRDRTHLGRRRPQTRPLTRFTSPRMGKG
jgi:hypothetical protein